MVLFSFRTILEKHQFSPLNDLEKNNDTGLLRLADKKNFGSPEVIAHMESLERDIVAYFKSRNEDSSVKINEAQQPSLVKAEPSVAAKTQPHRSGGSTLTTITPSVWSSGPAGTHVDDDNPYGGDPLEHAHHHDDGEHHQHHHDDEHHQHDDGGEGRGELDNTGYGGPGSFY